MILVNRCFQYEKLITDCIHSIQHSSKYGRDRIRDILLLQRTTKGLVRARRMNISPWLFSPSPKRRWIPPTVSQLCLFVAASHQTRLDTWSKARRPIKVGKKGRGKSGTSRDSNPAGVCCSSAHLVQCEPDEASSFTNPNVGPGTYAGLWLELDTKVWCQGLSALTDQTDQLPDIPAYSYPSSSDWDFTNTYVYR